MASQRAKRESRCQELRKMPNVNGFYIASSFLLLMLPNVKTFTKRLESYGVAATPRTRRGLDIEAGCGQLTQTLEKKEAREASEGGGGGGTGRS